MILKYARSARFFESGLVRFTQPAALNDPDEARPVLAFSRYSPEDYARAREQAFRAGLSSISDDDLEAMFLKPFPSGRYDEKSFPGLWPAYEPRLRDKPFSTLEEMDRCLADRAIELCIKHANASIGIFSLSTSTDEPMWAYYAADHAGVAIGFDESHPFLAGTTWPVIYSNSPIYVTTNSGWVRLGGQTLATEDILNSSIRDIPHELLLRKRLGWQHEQEWRAIQPLAKANSTAGIDEYGYSVHLFQVPPDAVRSVLFGYRAADLAIEHTLRRIVGNAQWNHIAVSRRKRLATGLIIEERLR